MIRFNLKINWFKMNHDCVKSSYKCNIRHDKSNISVAFILLIVIGWVDLCSTLSVNIL